MIAVVYSGSNHADWRLSDKGKTIASFKTNGINPYFNDEKHIVQLLNKNINLIHHAEPGGALDRAFATWSAAVARARREQLTPSAVFARAAREAAPAFGGADLRPALLERGYMITRLR